MLLAACGAGGGEPRAGAGAPSANQQLQALARQLAPAQDTSVAVFAFGERGRDASVLGEYLADKLMVQLLLMPTAQLVERARLDAIVREQRLGLTGALSDESAVSVGNLAGAAAVVVGTLTASGQDYELVCRLLDTRTGRVLAMAETRLPAASLPGSLTDPAPASAPAPEQAYQPSRPRPDDPPPLAPADDARERPALAPDGQPGLTRPPVPAWQAATQPGCQVGPLSAEHAGHLLGRLRAASFSQDKLQALGLFLQANGGGVGSGLLIAVLGELAFQADKLSALLALQPRLCPLSCAQVGEVLDAYPFSDDKLTVLGVLRPYISDGHNRAQILERFSFSSDRAAAAALLQ